LIERPAGLGMFRLEMRRFERERGAAVAEVRVEPRGYVEVSQLLEWAGLGGVRVRVDRDVRVGCVVLCAR